MTDRVQHNLAASQAPQRSPAAWTLDTLPFDSIKIIFSMLNLRNLQALTCVNRNMHLLTLEAATHNEHASINKFVKLIFNKLNGDAFTPQRGRLKLLEEKIPSRIPATGYFESLSSLKHKFILKIQQELIDAMQPYNHNTATSLALKHVKVPHFLENIVQLLEIYNKIPEALMIPNEIDRSSDLLNIYNDLMRANDIEGSIKVANSIPLEEKKSDALSKISKVLIRRGDIDRSLSIANSIPCKYRKASALRDISEVLINRDDLKNSLLVAISITGEECKGSALRGISYVLINRGDIDRALSIANSITHEEKKYYAILDISLVLLERGDIDRALSVVNSIPDEEHKDDALKHISERLLERGDIDRALSVANSISPKGDNEHKEYKAHKAVALGRISDVLIKRGDIDRALSVANSISFWFFRDNALGEIFRTLLSDHGNAERSLEAVNFMSDKGGGQSYGLAEISKFLIDHNDIEKSIEVANSISSQEFKKMALEYISMRLSKEHL